MAVTDATKVDLLLKKLAGVAKTDTAANKSIANESIASPALNRGDSIWLNAYLVPATANATIGTVTGYLQNNRVECTADTTSQRMSGSVYPTWKTGLTDWIPPEFDTVNVTNSYRVKVYYGASGLTDPSTSGGTQIFADGILGAGEWYFDYQAGILHFYGNSIPTGMTSSHVIYVFGYRYVGPKGLDYAFKIDSSVMRQDLTGIVGLPTLITLKGDVVVAENLTVTKDLEIQGGDLTTTETVFNLLNTTATTINFGGSATTIEIGAATGTTNINNNLEVDGDVVIDGDDLKTTSSVFNLIPDTAQTVNFATAATNLVVGATSGTTQIRNDLDVDGNLNVDGSFHIGEDLDVDGDLNIDGGDLTVSTATFNLANSNATTINFGGAATNIEIGSSEGTTNINNNLDVDGDLNIDGGDLTVSTAQFNLANENAQTINFGGDATIIEIGSSSGVTNVNNNLDVDGDLNLDGGDLTVSTEEFNLANTIAKSVNFAGEATNIEIGSSEGITNVNNNLDVDGDVNIDGGDLTVSTETFNLANTTAKTVNFAGQATNIEIGSSEGDTSVNNNLRVDGIVDVNNHLYVEGAARVNQSLEVEDSVKVQRELAVEGDVNLTRDLNVGGYIKGGQLIDTTIDCGEY
jgi:cytoskeletal protein CcmA (bactofilin family)